MAVVRNLMVRVGADLSNLKQGMAQANKEVQKFSQGINDITAGIGLSIGGMGISQVFMQATKAVMEVESSLTMLSRTMGSSVKEFNNWAQTTAAGFNMSTRDALVFGNTYSILLMNIAKDGQNNMEMTTKLLEASAVIANRTGRTMTDVMERIRSGFLGNTEAIEDLGIFVNVAMLQSTQTFRRFAGDKSWDQLDYRTQQLIRYFAILEQTSSTFGSEINSTTTASIQQLSASLDNLKLAIGEVIVPILNELVPALTDAAKWFKQIQEAAYQFGYTMGGGEGFAKKFADSVIETNKALQQQNKPQQQINKNLTETIKKMKVLAGFDEINLLGDSQANDTKKTADKINQSTKSTMQSNGKQPQANKTDSKTTDNKKTDKKDEEVNQYLQSAKDLAENTSNLWNSFTSGLKKVGESLDREKRPAGEVIVDQFSNLINNTRGIITDPIQKIQNAIGTKTDQKATPKPAPKPVTPTTTPNPVKKAVESVKTNKNMSSSYKDKSEPFVKPMVQPQKPTVAPKSSKQTSSVKPGTTQASKTTTTTKTTVTNPGLPVGSFLTPSKPKTKLATGGIIDRPTTALVGEAGSELIMPLENTSFVEKVAGALGTAVMTAMQMGNNMTGNNGKEVVLKIDGNTIARAINPYLTKEASRVGNAVISIT